MKLASLIIPETIDKGIDRWAYVRICIKKCNCIGFFPLLPDVYDTYVDRLAFVERTMAFVDMVVFFKDFELDEYCNKVYVIAEKLGKESIAIVNEETVIVEKTMTAIAILDDVCRRTGIPLSKMLTKTKKQEIVDARFIYFRRARELTRATLGEIGGYVGRTHCDVIYGIKAANNVYELVKQYNELYGKTNSKATPVETSKTYEAHAEQGAESILPHIGMEKKEQAVPVKKSIVPQVRGCGVYSAVGSL